MNSSTVDHQFSDSTVHQPHYQPPSMWDTQSACCRAVMSPFPRGSFSRKCVGHTVGVLQGGDVAIPQGVLLPHQPLVHLHIALDQIDEVKEFGVARRQGVEFPVPPTRCCCWSCGPRCQSDSTWALRTAPPPRTCDAVAVPHDNLSWRIVQGIHSDVVDAIHGHQWEGLRSSRQQAEIVVFRVGRG